MRIARHVIGYGLQFAFFLAGSFECAWGRILPGIGLGVVGMVLMLAIVPAQRPR